MCVCVCVGVCMGWLKIICIIFLSSCWFVSFSYYFLRNQYIRNLTVRQHDSILSLKFAFQVCSFIKYIRNAFPSVQHKSLWRWKRELIREVAAEGGSARCCWLWRWRKGLQAKECRQPLSRSWKSFHPKACQRNEALPTLWF